MFECRVGDPIENARFSGHPPEIIEIGGFHAAFGSFADAMDKLDQQGDQGIGDFLATLKHQSCQQGHANGLGVLANVGRRFGGNASPQAFNELADAAFRLPTNPFVGCLPADAEGIAEARNRELSSKVRCNEFHALIHGTRRFPGHQPSVMPRCHPCPGHRLFARGPPRLDRRSAAGKHAHRDKARILFVEGFRRGSIGCCSGAASHADAA